MFPILWRYGTMIIYSYQALLGLGLLLATAWLIWRKPISLWLDGWLWAVGVALLGGRIVFVRGEVTYFATHSTEAWQLWQGGLSYIGVVLGGLAGWVSWCLWCKRQKRPFLSPHHLTAPLALLHMFGWLACWAEGCAWGMLMHADAPFAFLATNLPDTYGVYEWRLHLPAIAFVVYLLWLGWLIWRRNHINPAWLLLPHLLFLPVRGDLDNLRVSLTLLFGGMVLTAVLLNYLQQTNPPKVDA